MNFIVDKSMPQDMIEKLETFGKVYKSIQISTNDESVSTHPDMQIHFITEDTAVCPPSTTEYYRDILPSYIKILSGVSEASGTYPEISAYNIARVGKFVICNTKFAEKSIIDFYKENEYTIVHTNQGYAKCNICPLSDNTFITEDKGIFNATKATQGIYPILINPGFISLKGFEYGFIGGATGSFKNNVFFCGSLKNNGNSKEIIDALSNCNCRYIELSDNPLCDLGSIIVFE